MLINLSNHPLAKWSEEQFSAAYHQYGEVVDIPFPIVNPNATETDIQALTETFTKKVKEFGTPQNVVVHVMGEMTVSYALVHELQTAGYTCVASTSIREIYEEELGKKTVFFKFVRFREY